MDSTFQRDLLLDEGGSIGVRRGSPLDRCAGVQSQADPAVASTPTPDDHRRGFAAATAALLAEFNAYLDRDQADLTKDSVGYLQHAIWLTDAELLTMIEGLRAAIVPNLANESTPTRRRYLLSPILVPAEDQPATS